MRNFKLLHGSTRSVFIVYGLAVKVPRMWSWRTFLNGLLANMQEVEFSSLEWPELCPILFSMPGGWLVIMPAVKELPEVSWEAIKKIGFPFHKKYTIPVEIKRDSFGVLGSRVVAIDYGT